MYRTGVDDVDWGTMADMAAGGDTLQEIANVARCSVSTAWKRLASRNSGVVRKRRPPMRRDWEAIKAEYEGNPLLCLEELGKKYGLTSGHLSVKLRAVGCRMRGKGWRMGTARVRHGEYADWIEIYKSDPEVTIQEIADAAGVTKQWVSWVMKRAGVETRGTGKRTGGRLGSEGR